MQLLDGYLINCLDLFAGAGYFSILAKKFFEITNHVLVEINYQTAKKLKNLFKNSVCVCCDASKFKYSIRFNLIFIDPPFSMGIRIINKCITNLFVNNIIENNSIILVKTDLNELSIDKLILIKKLNHSKSNLFIFKIYL